MTVTAAQDAMLHRNYFAPMLVETGYADAVIKGLTRNYPDSIKPSLQIIGKSPESATVSGMYIINRKEGPLFLSDCTVNKEPNEDELIDIVLQTAREVERLKITPRIAFLSYSNFGSVHGVLNERISKVVERLHNEHPELIVDGEMQASVALDPELQKNNFPFCKLNGEAANTLIFPNLASANIAHKLLYEMVEGDIIGPVLNGMNKSVQVLRMGASVNEIVNMMLVAVMHVSK